MIKFVQPKKYFIAKFTHNLQELKKCTCDGNYKTLNDAYGKMLDIEKFANKTYFRSTDKGL